MVFDNVYESNVDIIEDLRNRLNLRELSEQRMRSIQHKLDTQIDLFKLINTYTQQAFSTESMGELSKVIAEGVAEIFQLEVGAVFLFDSKKNLLKPMASFNIDSPGLEIKLADKWVVNNKLKGTINHTVFFESPIEQNSPWASLGLVHAVYMPFIDHEHMCTGLVLGCVTEAGESFYRFHPEELQYSFMVYGQQMNGIINNVIAMEEVKKADRAKSVFLANLSHEMRTPMNAIIGMARACLKKDASGSLHKEITQIEISSRHLLSLINDILDISKIEGGNLELSSEVFCLREIIDNLMVNIKPLAKNKNLVVSTDFAIPESCCFIGDPMRLSQVLLNLLSNAIKFTPDSGKVTFTIEEISKGSDKAKIKFSVRDTGIGISPEFMPDLFSPFKQVDSSISRRYEGTGLGLAISQRIVNEMGGVIHVESEIDVGTLFYFSISLAITEKTVASGANEVFEVPDLFGKTALVVDDLEVNREIIRVLLEQTGIEIYEAQDGQKAVDMVEISDEGFYDLIIMDIQMPVIDGYAAVKKIRALDREDVKNIVILAMSANAFQEDINKSIASGMNGHLSKPVEEKLLLKAISEKLV